MKKILFIHHAQGCGGAPINMVNIINALDKSKYQVKVLLLKDSIVSEKLLDNSIPYLIANSLFYRKFYKYYAHTVPGSIKLYQFKSQIIAWLSWFFSKNYFAKRELKGIDFDIVHLNSSVLTDWLKPCREKAKVVMHIQEPLTRGYFGIRHKFFKNQMRKYADHIIAISKDNAERVNLLYKTTVVYNFSFIEDLEELEIEKYKSKSVLYLGGSARIKGYYTLINALPFLDDDIVVYFAGGYTSRKSNKKTIKNRLKKIVKSIIIGKRAMAIKKMNNSSSVVNIGMINDVNEYLDKVTCLVSPFSVPHFSRPIIEAFGRKKPVIATDLEGINEVVDDGVNGILVEEGNSKELAEKINLLCSKPVLAKKMGDNGYLEAKKKYSHRNVKEVEKVYDMLCNSPMSSKEK